MAELKTINDALQWAKSILAVHDRDRNVGELLLMHICDCSRAVLLANLYLPLPEQDSIKFIELLELHAKKGVPVQHLIGTEVFWGRKFIVNEHVLVPRMETEELVDYAKRVIKRHFSDRGQLKVADIGTGSGIIAVTMKLECPTATVHAVDISNNALMVAQKNAAQLGAEINFYQGNLVEPLIDSGIQVDILLANLPYIPIGDRERLQDVVRDYDPDTALFSGEDGLDLYREMIPRLSSVLFPKALIGFEIGSGQGVIIKQLLSDVFPTAEITIMNDINGNERMVFARKDF